MGLLSNYLWHKNILKVINFGLRFKIWYNFTALSGSNARKARSRFKL